MIPILYPSEEISFSTNGICRLPDCVSFEVTEERNGVYEAEFKYPITGAHYEEILIDRIVLAAHDETGDLQPFDIYAKSAPINGLVTFNARHISYRLSYSILRPFTASSVTQAMAMIVPNSLTNNQFTFWTNKRAKGDFAVKVPKSVRSILGGDEGSILDVYGAGDFEFDKFQVKLHTNRGKDSGVEIRYGKNLLDITHELDYSEAYAGVIPYWQSNDEDDPEVVIADEVVYAHEGVEAEDVWTAYNGTSVVTVGDQTDRPIDITYIDYSGSKRDRVSYWEAPDPDANYEIRNVVDQNGDPIDLICPWTNVVPLDLTSSFSSKPTQAALIKQAKEILNDSQAWMPKENIEVDFVAMWQTPEYEKVAALQRVRLCDTVSVYYPKLGVNAVKQKVIKVVYDVLRDRYSSIELGAAQTTFSDVVTASLKTATKDMVTADFLQLAVEHATELIRGGLGGHVVIPEGNDEILILDTTDISTAVNVLRINKNGIGFSANGYDGPFHTAWTLDGHFVADYIDTGQLQASLIKVGILMDQEGKNYWNMETGEFRLTGYTTNDELASAIHDAKVYSQNRANEAESNAALASARLLSDYDQSMNAQAVFNKLTNNGQIQGIAMQDGNLYINASYINTGTLTAITIRDKDWKNWWNLATGDMHIEASNVVTSDGASVQDSITTIKNQKTGGTNLIINTLFPDVSTPENRPKIKNQTVPTNTSSGTVTAATHGLRITSNDAVRPIIRFGTNDFTYSGDNLLNGLKTGRAYTMSFDIAFRLLGGASIPDENDYAVRAIVWDNYDPSTDQFTSTWHAAESFTLATIKMSERGLRRNYTGKSFTFSIDSRATRMYISVSCEYTDSTAYASGEFIELDNLKLEVGDTATDWSPAPEDLAGYTDTQVGNVVNKLETEYYTTLDIDTKERNIRSEVGEVQTKLTEVVCDGITLSYTADFDSQAPKIVFKAKVYQDVYDSSTNTYTTHVDVTDQMLPRYFSWAMVTESGHTRLNPDEGSNRKQITVDPTDFGYGGHLELIFTILKETDLIVSNTTLAVGSDDLIVHVSKGDFPD